MLRKARVKEKVSSTAYLVEDVFDQSTLLMSTSGKQRMNYFELTVGEEVYVMCSPYASDKCRMVTITDFKMDDSGGLLAKKIELDSRKES